MTTTAQLRQVRQWAASQGVELHHDRHALAILETLEETRTSQDAWRLVAVSSRGWSGRQCRTEAERRAIWCGESYRGKAAGGKGRRNVFYLVPKIEDSPA